MIKAAEGRPASSSQAASSSSRRAGTPASPSRWSHVKGYRLTCVVPENVTEERRELLRLLGVELILSPGAEGSNGAVTLALELAEREPRYYLPFQYRE